MAEAHEAAHARIDATPGIGTTDAPVVSAAAAAYVFWAFCIVAGAIGGAIVAIVA